MRPVLFALALSSTLMAADIRIDHVTVAGRDVHAMQRALQQAGLPSEYGGPHANHATEMALTSFPDGSYLELIAIQPEADAAAVKASPWHICMEGNAGPCGWAVRPADMAAESARLRNAGIAITAAAKNGRKRPDGVQLEWETIQVGSGNGDFFPFLIHDFTPRDRRAYPSGKPTTTEFTGVGRVVLAVKDLNAAVADYQRAYGLPAPQKQEDPSFGAHLAWFAGSPVVLAAPDGPQSWLTERLRKFGQTPCAFILETKRGRAGNLTLSNWFGNIVGWLSPDTLGWRLGFSRF